VDDLLWFSSKEYVAVSDFGSYLERTNAEITLDSEAMTQRYGFVSELSHKLADLGLTFERYKTETDAYIRTGIVYYENGGATPIYGVAVGQNLITKITNDGQTEIEQKNFRATYTASKLSFWQDDTEVAYVSNNMLYIPNATIVDKLNVGDWEVTTGDGLKFKWMGG
jgi:hypothetical protein